MSYANPRITLADDTRSIIIKMSGGNPGAMNVLMQIVEQGATIDPDDVFGSLGPMLGLDTLDIYEGRIWMLYKDLCGQDIVSMLGMLRAVQLGHLDEGALQRAIDHGEPENGWVAGHLAKVRERLPRFGQATA